MRYHQLIGIDDLIKLNPQELRNLDVRLRQILDHDTSLTDRDIAVIIASLKMVTALVAGLNKLANQASTDY
jgi:exonuclease V gamma subunit